jgi:hypothetical protein
MGGIFAKQMRDTIVNTMKDVSTSEAVHRISRTIYDKCLDNADQILFGTEDVKNELINISRYAKTSNAVLWWSNAIYSIIQKNTNNTALFGTEDVRNAFVNISRYATTQPAVLSWSNTIFYITFRNNNNQSLFCTEAVRDSNHLKNLI